MKFLIALIFFAGVCAQDFVHIQSYTTHNCSGDATDLGYYVSGTCWGFDGFILTELNSTDTNYVRYETNCNANCVGCQINQNLPLGSCTSDMRTLTNESPTMNVDGGIAFELYAQSGCDQLQAVAIYPPNLCYALTDTSSFFMVCNGPDYDIDIFTCDDNSCDGDCEQTSSFPTQSPSGVCYASSNMTYPVPTFFKGYCNVYPPVVPTTTTSTSAAATTTSTTGAAATTTSATSGATSTTTAAATTTTTTTTAAAAATSTTTAAAATTTTSSTTAAAATTTTSTTAAAATTTTTSTTAAAATTTTGTTTTASATTTTTAAATATTTTTTGTATVSLTTIKFTTSDAHILTFGALISAVCIAICLLL